MTEDNIKHRFLSSVKFPLYFVLTLWIIHIFSWLTGISLHWLGVYPRTTSGLMGVLTAPFIHGDFLHLFSNSIPFLLLTFMLFFFYRKIAVQSFVLIYLMTGLLVWIFARSSYHIGASGVIYGLVAFVFWSGIFRRNLKSIVLALVVTVLYSGYFLGIVPGEEGISWESHLLGGIVGIIVAFIYRSDLEQEELEQRKKEWDSELELGEQTYFFPPDVFDDNKGL